jgi:hypothetical protein
MFLAKFSVGDDEYTAHVSQAEWAPSQPTASVTDISGKVTNFGGKSGYVLNLAGFQDWATANSLSAYLTAHDGETASVTLEVPGGSWAGTVTLAATTIGGTSNSPAVFSVALQTSGKPVFTPSAAIVTDNQWAIAITGTPAGGTYTLTFNGYATAPLVYNATTTAVDAAIEALSGVTGIAGVTVTGTAASYTIVFPSNVTMAVAHAFTGGTAPAISATAV